MGGRGRERGQENHRGRKVSGKKKNAYSERLFNNLLKMHEETDEARVKGERLIK